MSGFYYVYSAYLGKSSSSFFLLTTSLSLFDLITHCIAAYLTSPTKSAATNPAVAELILAYCPRTFVLTFSKSFSKIFALPS
jgi:uncharacterized membrane protein YhdT